MIRHIMLFQNKGVFSDTEAIAKKVCNKISEQIAQGGCALDDAEDRPRYSTAESVAQTEHFRLFLAGDRSEEAVSFFIAGVKLRMHDVMIGRLSNSDFYVVAVEINHARLISFGAFKGTLKPDQKAIALVQSACEVVFGYA